MNNDKYNSIKSSLNKLNLKDLESIERLVRTIKKAKGPQVPEAIWKELRKEANSLDEIKTDIILTVPCYIQSAVTSKHNYGKAYLDFPEWELEKRFRSFLKTPEAKKMLKDAEDKQTAFVQKLKNIAKEYNVTYSDLFESVAW